MSSFKFEGYWLDDGVIYNSGEGYDNVPIVVRQGDVSDTLLGIEYRTACGNDLEWVKLSVDSSKYLVSCLKPIGVLKNDLVLERSLEDRYEIGKVYIFSNQEDFDIDYSCVGILEKILEGCEDGHQFKMKYESDWWEYIKPLSDELIGSDRYCP